MFLDVLENKFISSIKEESNTKMDSTSATFNIGEI
jgi:hypothetical protein